LSSSLTPATTISVSAPLIPPATSDTSLVI
jgi:hypothetical protein